jgi:hypothetical protein
MRNASTIARGTAIRSSLQTIVGLQPLSPTSTGAPEVLELGWLLDGKIGGLPPQAIRRMIHRVASEPSPSAETMGWSTTICPDCLVTRPKPPA